jgi:hypothetical protein
MSLLKKASIITTPTAYAEDYLYSIKPAYALGSELVTNGGFESSASWTVSGTDSTHIATFSNGTLRYQSDTTSPQLIVAQASVLQTGRLYKITVNVTTLTSGYVKVDSLGGLNITPSAGTNIFYKTATGTTFNITRGTTNVDVTIDSISVVEVTDADFDFDRNSTGTRVNEDYLIEDVPYNIIKYTEDLTVGGVWLPNTITITNNYGKSPNGEQSSIRLVLGNLTASRIAQAPSLMNGTTYTFSCYYKGTAGEKLYMEGSGSGGSGTQLSKLVTLTGRWQREELQFVGGSTSNLIYIVDSRNGAEDNAQDFEVWGVQLVKGNQKDYLKTTDRLDIPRIDYTNGEPSILLEPSRTNLETKSNEFSTWGLVSNVTRTASYTQSPEGLDNATRLQFTANGFTASFTQSNSTQYTLSCYAKRNDSSTQNVGFFVDGSGAVDSQFALTSTWQRFTYTYTSTNTSYAGLAGLSGADVSVYGMQVEAGSYATSLIHTSGSAVTRSQDVGSNAGNSDLISSVEGVLYTEVNFKDITAGTYLSISDGSSSNRIIIGVQAGTARVYASSLVTTFTIDFNRYNKIAYSYKANQRKIFLNGESVYSSTASYTVPTGLKELSFDSTGTGAQDTEGNVKSVMVFKEALTDLELEKLTGYNNHELYMNYYNRLSYLGLAEEYNVESDINNYIL